MAAQDPGVPPTPQDWLTPTTQTYPPGQHPGTYPAPYPGYGAPPPAPIFELRPLTLSEILDRIFALYRSRFWLFAGIAAFSGAVQALAAAAQMLVQGKVMRQAMITLQGGAGAGTAANVNPAGIVAPLLTFAGTLVFFLAFCITSAATAFAVGEVYLGRSTTVKEAFRATIGRWYSYLGVGLWQLWTFMWIPLLLLVPGFVLIALRSTTFVVLGGVFFIAAAAGMVVGYILYLRNAFGIPAVVTERLKVRAGMRRSKVLTSGTKFRIFVLHMVALALYMVVGVLQTPVALFAGFTLLKHGTQSYGLQSIVLIIGFLGHTVVSPVAMIGLMMLYIDQRVRKEAFDIAVLLGDETAVEVGAPPVDVTPEAIDAAAASHAESGYRQEGDAPLL